MKKCSRHSATFSAGGHRACKSSWIHSTDVGFKSLKWWFLFSFRWCCGIKIRNLLEQSDSLEMFLVAVNWCIVLISDAFNLTKVTKVKYESSFIGKSPALRYTYTWKSGTLEHVQSTEVHLSLAELIHAEWVDLVLCQGVLSWLWEAWFCII